MMAFNFCFPPEMTFVMAYVLIFFSSVSSAESAFFRQHIPVEDKHQYAIYLFVEKEVEAGLQHSLL